MQTTYTITVKLNICMQKKIKKQKGNKEKYEIFQLDCICMKSLIRINHCLCFIKGYQYINFGSNNILHCYLKLDWRKQSEFCLVSSHLVGFPHSWFWISNYKCIHMLIKLKEWRKWRRKERNGLPLSVFLLWDIIMIRFVQCYNMFS